MEKADSPGTSSGPAQTGMDERMPLDDFIASGRTGRRNAMPDILDSQKAGVGTSQLTYEMEKMNCSDTNQQTSQPTSTNPATSQGS